RPDLMQDLDAGRVRRLDVGRRITPERREYGRALLDAGRNLLRRGERQDEVDAEGPVGQLPHTTDEPANERRRVGAERYDPETARVADRRHQLRARDGRPHRRRDDRQLDAQQVTQAGAEHAPSGVAVSSGGRTARGGGRTRSASPWRPPTRAPPPSARSRRPPK